jgi:Tol biopolymer transport system component
MKHLFASAVLVFQLLLMAGAPAGAQVQRALTAPLLAATDALLERILIYDLAGQRRELRFDTRQHFIWGFSPDGCRIILTLTAPGGISRIYSTRLDGSDLRPLVHMVELPDQDWSAWEPQVNPVDGRVAFTLFRRERLPGRNTGITYHIAWVPAEGGSPQFYSVSGAEHSPEWSPDGAWLAYAAYDGRVPGPEPYATVPPTPASGATPVPLENLINEADLWAVSRDGQTKYRLTAFPVGSVRDPRWSPDSLLISFIYSATPFNDSFWIIGNADAAIPTQRSFEWTFVLDTTWLPDGSALLASVRDFQGVSENRLWQIPLVGSADTDAVPYPLDPALRYVDYPRFSADGRYLALRSEYAMAVIDTQTGGWGWLEDAAAGNTPPVWSPAGYAGEAACPASSGS